MIAATLVCNRFSRSGDLCAYRREWKRLSSTKKQIVIEWITLGESVRSALDHARGFERPLPLGLFDAPSANVH